MSKLHPRLTVDFVHAEVDQLRSELNRLAAELTEVRAHAASLELLAHEDTLTDLLNRRGFLRDLTRAIAYRARYGTPVALLLADLDAFKPINDRYGHDMGDRALRHVADVLRGNVRASDSVGRLGGDEFGLILWNVDHAALTQKAQALEGMIATWPMPAAPPELALGASIGFTLLQAGDTAEEALSRADQAMYARKTDRRSLRR